MTLLMDQEKVIQSISSLAKSIIGDVELGKDIAVVGVRSRGEVLGKRLSAKLSEILGKDVPNGTLDITLYRDDINNPQIGSQPKVRSTDIPFEVDGNAIILADDVLHTGRSCRAALDAILAFGRPAMIRLAVLVDRGQREYPIQADYVGYHANVQNDELIKVHFVESDGVDEILVVKND